MGAGLSIGVSLARNLIGWEPGSGGSLTEKPSWVHADVYASVIDATGDLTVQAVSDAQIDALVLAISVAIAGGAGAIAVTGAGSSADNRISTDVKAYIEGGTVTTGVLADVRADNVKLTARDTSRILSSVAAGSVGVAGGAISVAVSIAVALATKPRLQRCRRLPQEHHARQDEGGVRRDPRLEWP